MNFPLFEPFREWVESLVGGRARKSPMQKYNAKGARIVRAGGSPLERASRKINCASEQERSELNTKQRSLEAAWL